MPEVIKCFPPIVNSNTKVLILGSLPGIKSLKLGQYYAHPQNQFWYFIGRLLGKQDFISKTYSERVQNCFNKGLGIGAAIVSGEREASADSTIRKAKAIDLAQLIYEHNIKSLNAVFFEGRKAQEIFMKQTYSDLDLELKNKIVFHYLPSSSPAYAAMNVQTKWENWKIVQGYLK